jgi:hypothetical protein
MFLLFPLLYISSFLYFFKGLFLGKPERILWFFLIGMTVYTTALSVSYGYGLLPVVNVIKYFKEIAAITTLGYLLLKHEGPLKFHWIDIWVLGLFLYCLMYVFLPVGKLTFIEKLTVFKSYGLFGLLYFIGKLLPLKEMDLRKIVLGIISWTVFAVVVQSLEWLTYQHLQTLTSYTDYNQKVNLLYPSGSFGLTFTFETDLMVKRFASFFNDPLDFAISLLFALCLALSWISFSEEKIIRPKHRWLIVVILLWGLYLTFSRASMLGSVIVLYLYAILTKRQQLLRTLYFGLFLGFVLFMVFANIKFKAYVFDTINLRESSSLGHLISWVTGLDAIFQQPLGMGLGSSGLYAFGDGLGIGGESQPIFMGVSTGIISMLAYLVIYIGIIVVLAKNWSSFSGYTKVIAFALMLFKLGAIIPMLTSYFESFLYLSYMTWLFSGYVINQVLREK